MGVKLKGIDTSTWQGTLSAADFQKAKNSGVQYVILRLGFTGSSSNKPTLDNQFENSYKSAIAAGLPVGVYYYTLAKTEAKAREEAQFCIEHLKGKKISYPVYFDVEDPKALGKQSKSTLAKTCNAFCSVIGNAGYIPGVYASISWFNDKIGTISATHTKWVAQYYKECQYKGAYDMGQYSSSESVPGIASKTDVNWCYKDFAGGDRPTPQKTTYPGTFPRFLRYLEKGDKGSAVKNLQGFLNWALDLNLVEDGIFGQSTYNAVKQFQKKIGLEADGIFGKKSLAEAKKFMR